MTDLLFVYGTLKRGQPGRHAAYLAANSEFVSEATVLGDLYSLGAYPGLVDGENTVRGELFRLRSDSILNALDAYEGDEYRRVRRSVSLANGESVEAWIYLYCRAVEGKDRVESGYWK